jgi:hypothetical protein
MRRVLAFLVAGILLVALLPASGGAQDSIEGGDRQGGYGGTTGTTGGGPAPGSDRDPAYTGDSRAPRVRVQVLRARLAVVRRTLRIKARVRSDEEALVFLQTVVGGRKGKLRQLVYLRPQTKRVTLKISARARRSLRRAGARVRVTAVAVDRAQNVRRSSGSRRLRR